MNFPNIFFSFYWKNQTFFPKNWNYLFKHNELIVFFFLFLEKILTFAREQPFENLSDEKVVENFGHIYKDDKKHVSNVSHYDLGFFFCQIKLLSRIFQIFTFNLKCHCMAFRRSTWTSFVIKFLWGHISLLNYFLFFSSSPPFPALSS